MNAVSRYAVTPDVSISSIDKSWADAIVARLGELTGDSALSLVRIEEGSVRLVLEGSREGYERLEAMFRSGRLAEALGAPVADLAWLGIPSEVETTVGRSDSLRSSREGRPATAPVRVLILTANPTDTDRLALDEEMREITTKIRAAQYRDSLELISWWATRPDDLLQAFNQYRPQIVHFSGHGSKHDEIILVDQDGRSKPVSKRALKSLFTTLGATVRLVLLNACYSQSQAEAIVEVCDCAVGMKFGIGDRAARTFSAAFYRALGFGRSVQEAFDQGKTALLLEGIPEETTPELLVREGVNASNIVLVHAR
jgi:hypothetical protein